MVELKISDYAGSVLRVKINTVAGGRAGYWQDREIAKNQSERLPGILIDANYIGDVRYGTWYLQNRSPPIPFDGHRLLDQKQLGSAARKYVGPNWNPQCAAL